MAFWRASWSRYLSRIFIYQNVTALKILQNSIVFQNDLASSRYMFWFVSMLKMVEMYIRTRFREEHKSDRSSRVRWTGLPCCPKTERNIIRHNLSIFGPSGSPIHQAPLLLLHLRSSLIQQQHTRNMHSDHQGYRYLTTWLLPQVPAASCV